MKAQDIKAPQGFNWVKRDNFDLPDEAIVHLYLDEDQDPLTLGYQPQEGDDKPWWFVFKLRVGNDGSFKTQEEMLKAVENDYTDYLCCNQ